MIVELPLLVVLIALGLVPVIAADRGALPQAVGTAGRLIDPTDPVGLARALREILEQRPLRDRMSDAGRRHAEAFTWTATAGHIREALTLAVEQRRRRNG